MSFGFGLTARMQRALADGLPMFLFAIIDHPDGMVYLWNGVGDIDYDGNTYSGRGALASFGQVESSSILQISERTMVLRGIDPEATEFLSANVRNREAQFALGCVDDQWRVVPDPYIIDIVQMDSQTLPIEDNGAISLQISGYSGLWSLQMPLDNAWSSEQAKLEYPDETGFDAIPALVDKETKWTQT